MSAYSDSNRWWENYLVRYFIPSIFGMFIIMWLDQNTGCLLMRYIPMLNLSNWENFSMSHLLVWVLFGSLYCYIASYPCLVFHSTRVIDFKDVTGNPTNMLLNPYLVSILFMVFACLAALENCMTTALIDVVIFSLVQIYRLFLSYSKQDFYGFTYLKGKGLKTSVAYAYLNKLSKRRSVISEEEDDVDEENGDRLLGNEEKKNKSISLESDEQDNHQVSPKEETRNQNTSSRRKSKKRTRNKDIADSYRHLREHGNTAFIILLEIALCPIMLVALNKGGITYASLVLAIWILPSVFVHWFAQHLERRYSLFKHKQ